MYRDKTFSVSITDWPAVGRTTNLSLDARVFSSAEAIEETCKRRYGKGTLKVVENDGDEPTYRYTRHIGGPAELLKAFSFLLNKSYS